MALTGQLSDMSLAELIEFFCNQRKTGRLKVDYHRGHGVFFIKEGELVDAKVGQLSGQEAVYFALTLPNAAFDFSPEVPPTRRTIEVVWTQVVLEGLRRLDEGLSPTESDAFGGWTPSESDLAVFMDQVERLGENSQASARKDDRKAAPASVDEAPLSMMVDSASADGGSKKKWVAMGAAACVVLAVAVAAIPLLGSSGKPSAKSAAAAAAPEPAAQTNAPANEAAATDGSSSEASSEATPAEAADASSDAERREREERERRLREQRERRAEELARKSASNQNTSIAASGPKSVRVTVIYDEAGRVTAASFAGATPGAEAYASTAVRAARGRRFPAGKSGSTVVTIPVN